MPRTTPSKRRPRGAIPGEHFAPLGMGSKTPGLSPASVARHSFTAWRGRPTRRRLLRALKREARRAARAAREKAEQELLLELVLSRLKPEPVKRLPPGEALRLMQTGEQLRGSTAHTLIVDDPLCENIVTSVDLAAPGLDSQVEALLLNRRDSGPHALYEVFRLPTGTLDSNPSYSTMQAAVERLQTTLGTLPREPRGEEDEPRLNYTSITRARADTWKCLACGWRGEPAEVDFTPKNPPRCPRCSCTAMSA